MNSVRIGIVGLGRLGKCHAQTLAFHCPGAEIVAACSVVDKELQWARENIGVENVYNDYHEMLATESMDAVFLVSSSTVHAEQIIAGINANVHVFCEKPMGLTVDECLRVEEAQKNNKKILFIGFVRRFDPSYAYAKQKIDEGCIGEPFLVRSQTVDINDFAEFQLDFVKTAGGIFLDCNVHDIDLIRWFLSADIEMVHAIGASFVHPGFDALQDADNAVALCQCTGKKMAIISTSRTAFHGHDTHTEITGTKGILKIGMTPSKNRVEIFDQHGARTECVYDFYERFEQGFKNEVQHFVRCIQEGLPSPTKAEDGTHATRIAHALTESFRDGRPVHIGR